MSRGLVRCNDEGVVLRYADPAAKRAHHEQREVQPNDLERIAVLKAERALILLQTITEHAEFSDYALSRIEDAMEDISDTLQLKRRQFGMYTETGA